MLKDMSIRKKLLTACSSIALLGCIIGIVSIVMMRSITSQYNDALNRYGFAQGDVGELLAAFAGWTAMCMTPSATRMQKTGRLPKAT